MKRKRILMIMVVLTMGMIGCASKPKEDEISVESDSPQEMESEEAAAAKTTELSQPEITEDAEKASSEVEEIPTGDPMAGIVEKYEGNILTLRTPEDDMLYYFFTENVPILEGYSTENAHEIEGGSRVVVGDKVEISYRGTLDDEEHPTEAVKIVVIKDK